MTLQDYMNKYHSLQDEFGDDIDDQLLSEEFDGDEWEFIRLLIEHIKPD